MAWTAMLNHTCDIYHIGRADTSPGYGLPPSPGFSYAETPDLTAVPCHFNIKGAGTVGVVVRQNEPYAELDGRVKLNLPTGTDARLNDKIINTQTGIAYTAEMPQDVRGHHVIVMLRRAAEQEPIV